MLLDRIPITSDIVPVLIELSRKPFSAHSTNPRFWFLLKGYMFGYMRGVHAQREQRRQPVTTQEQAESAASSRVDLAVARYCEAISALPGVRQAVMALSKLMDEIRSGRANLAAYMDFLAELPAEGKEEHYQVVRQFMEDILAEG